ncbi:Eukaryotic translation initiation factor 5B [Folsomia candida]|uniref:Eukaryotic translation initiation factor 5B n=1 Tax=Folsomia candida TaxID=158441 RepID=A0A226DNK8_FOLCA|nr:Eukaryotic translation initiation factor 5B [Folsomia candida]
MDKENMDGDAGESGGDQQPATAEGAESGKRELTAAQKKREKLKQKKELAKQKGGEEGGDGESTTAAGQEDDKAKEQKKPAAAKKGAKEPEKPKPRKGGPSAAQIAAIQENIRKQREEEERLLKEEEEKIRLLEESENARLEKLRLEQEKKEREKRKKKEKIARLKEQGLLLTEKEKLAKQRAKITLDALKAQGFEVPEAGKGGKTSRAGTRVRPKKQVQSQTSTEEQSASGEAGGEDNENATPKTQEEIEEEQARIKEAWDQESETDEEKEIKRQKEAEDGAASNDEVSKSSEINEAGSDGENLDSLSQDDETGSVAVIEPVSEVPEKKEIKEKEPADVRIHKRREENQKARTLKNLRSPVVCVLGHVDTGKTKILDKLRRTHVQDNEAGGITQQIGATNVPITAIKEAAKFVKGFADLEMKVPGLLIIDTPGHESFSNLRSRGSSLCDIAILVVDIMHGLEPQTLESINLLKAKKTPFVVALNKIDRLYDWQSSPKRDVRDIIKSQPKITVAEFDKRSKEVMVQFAEQSLNAALFYDNPDPSTYISMIPTSAVTGDGMGNLMALIVELSQTMLAKRLMFSKELQATVLEVKAIPGLGTTIDVILINGFLRIGETIVVAGTEGPITTQIRSLLTPDGMKELRVKNTYVEHKEISGTIGVKIAAKDFEKAIAGLSLVVAHQSDEVEFAKEEITRELKTALNSIRLSERGVYVQASTLGSLEALLEFLKVSQIPFIFNTRDPIVVGVVVEAGVVREGTPICVPSKEFVEIGRVTSIEINHKQMEKATKGQEVCIKIEPAGDSPKMLGRHFEETDVLVSKITRESIDACKEYFRNDLSKTDWQLMVELKKLFQIM